MLQFIHSRLARRARPSPKQASSAAARGSTACGSDTARALRRGHRHALEPIERDRQRGVPPGSPDAVGRARRRSLRNRGGRGCSTSPRLRVLRPFRHRRRRAEALPSGCFSSSVLPSGVPLLCRHARGHTSSWLTLKRAPAARVSHAKSRSRRTTRCANRRDPKPPLRTSATEQAEIGGRCNDRTARRRVGSPLTKGSPCRPGFGLSSSSSWC
jgi:hypothetical protein